MLHDAAGQCIRNWFWEELISYTSELVVKKINLFMSLSLLFVMFSVCSVQAQFLDENKNYKPRDQHVGKMPIKSLYGKRQIVLTFDDGPDVTVTPKILNELAKYNVKATFFLLANKINAKTKPVIKRMFEEGHLVATHDYDHKDNNKETESEFRNGLERAINIMESVERELGYSQREMYFRFPYGNYGKPRKYHHFNVVKEVSEKVYGENCIVPIYWDIDTKDWLLPPEKIAQNIISYVDGGIRYDSKVTLFGRMTGNYGKQKIIEKYIANPAGGGVALLHDIKGKEKNIKTVRIFLKYAEKNDIEIIPLNEVKEFRYGSRICEPISK